MQLQRESSDAFNTVTAYGSDYIEINKVPYRHPVWFAPEGDIHEWDVRDAADITAATLSEIAGLAAPVKDPMAFLDGDTAPAKPPDAPEVVLVGTGERQHLLPAEAIRPLLRAGIGVEAMSTQAAARTYNILMSEGRRVVIALLPQKEAT